MSLTKTLTRWAPVNDLFRDRMDRMFDDFLRDFVPVRPTEELAERRWMPVVDIKETPESLVLTAELPGLAKEDVQISVENQTLTIHGERKFENETKGDTYHRIERSYGSFLRTFTLPANIKTDKIAAAFANGLLTITLAKVEEAKPRQIEIK